MVAGAAYPLHFLLAAPTAFFLFTLTVMLFRPPDLVCFAADRIAFGGLVGLVLLRALWLRQSIPLAGPVTLPLLGLTLLAFADLWSGPFAIQNWSVFAAKWAVPLVLFILVQMVFADGEALQKFETYSLIVLAYLVLIAIFFLIGADSLVFPRYMLDENLGIHADRARGPFLQAVANGVTLNLLALLALNAFRRRRVRGVFALLLLLALPLAALATKTRSVWLSFALSATVLLFFSSNARIRRACRWLVFAGMLGALSVLLLAQRDSSLAERLQEDSPVEFRLALYRAGWDMFGEKPLLGWSSDAIQPELRRRIDDFHGQEFFFHNSYLEVGVNHGLAGLALYLWVFVDLLRLGRQPRASRPVSFLDSEFRALWPVMVGVYALNAFFVVMNYQFVNGLLFTVAGMLAAQRRRDRMPAFRG